MEANKTGKVFFPGLVTASLFFFFNPAVNVIDVLPDLFGYILLLFAMRYLRDLNDDLSTAYMGFFKMIPVEFVKGAAILVIFGLFPPSERPVGTLLVVFAISVVELFLLIPAISHLFVGLTTLANRHGSASLFAMSPEKNMPPKPVFRPGREKADEAAYRKKCEKVAAHNATRACALDKARVAVYVFVWIKTALAILPEFSALSGEGVVWYNYISLFRTFAILAGLIVGIIWLVNMCRFIRKIRADEVFLGAIQEQYESEIAPHEEIYIQRTVTMSLIFLCVGAALSVDFYINYYNLLPDILGVILLGVGVMIMRRYVKKTTPVMAVLGLYGVVTLAASVLTIYFNSTYYLGAILRDDSAYATYIAMVTLTIAENVLFFVSLCLIGRCLRDMILRYTGFSMTDGQDPTSAEHLRHVHRELNRYIYRFLAAAAVSSIVSCVYELTKISLGFMWMIDFAVAVVFVCLFVHATSQIREQMEYKYMLS